MLENKIKSEIQREKIRLISSVNLYKYNDMKLATIIFEVSELLAKTIVQGKEKYKKDIEVFTLYYGLSPQAIYDAFLREDDQMIHLFASKTYA